MIKRAAELTFFLPTATILHDFVSSPRNIASQTGNHICKLVVGKQVVCVCPSTKRGKRELHITWTGGRRLRQEMPVKTGKEESFSGKNHSLSPHVPHVLHACLALVWLYFFMVFHLVPTHV